MGIETVLVVMKVIALLSALFFLGKVNASVELTSELTMPQKKSVFRNINIAACAVVALLVLTTIEAVMRAQY